MVAYLWPEASAPLTFLENEQDPAQEQAGPDLIFRTADGYITAAAVTDAEWAGMCRAFGREELTLDPRFKTAAARGHNRTERRTIMNREIARWPTAEILARLDREVVPAAPVLRRSGRDRGRPGGREPDHRGARGPRSRPGAPAKTGGPLSPKPRPRSGLSRPGSAPITRRSWKSSATTKPASHGSSKKGWCIGAGRRPSNPQFSPGSWSAVVLPGFRLPPRRPGTKQQEFSCGSFRSKAAQGGSKRFGQRPSSRTAASPPAP